MEASHRLSSYSILDMCRTALQASGRPVPLEREEMIREGVRDLRNVQVGSFTGLTVKYAKQIGANVILRGLRAVSDFEFELQMAMMNETLEPGISTIFMAPAPAYSFLSSSLVKEIARFGGDVSQFVPPHVERLLIQRIKENGIR
jgi:pantetheine-phosphate adenylyltransferase